MRLLRFPTFKNRLAAAYKRNDVEPKTIKPEDVAINTRNWDNEDRSVIDLYNARSWNKETHPQGIGDSLWVAAVHWDPDNKLLIRFRDGFKAQYEVEEDVAKELIKADSKGRYVAKHIKDLPYNEYKGSII